MRQALASGLCQQAAIDVDQAPRPIGRRQGQHAAMPPGPARHLARAQRPDEVAAEDGLQPRQARSAAPAPAPDACQQARQEAGRRSAGSGRLRLGCSRLMVVGRQLEGLAGRRPVGCRGGGIGRPSIGQVGPGVRPGIGRQIAVGGGGCCCCGSGRGQRRRVKVGGGGKCGRRFGAVGIGRGQLGCRLVCGATGAVGRRLRRRRVGVGRQLDQHLRPVVRGRGRLACRRRVGAEQVVALVVHRQHRGRLGRGVCGGIGRVGPGRRVGRLRRARLGRRAGRTRRRSGLGVVGGLGREGKAVGARRQAGQRGGHRVQQIAHRRQRRGAGRRRRHLGAGKGQQHLADAVHLACADAARQRVPVVPGHHPRQHLIEP